MVYGCNWFASSVVLKNICTTAIQMSFPPPNTGIVDEKKSRYNGYSLFWSQSMRDRLPLANESKECCRKRIMVECQRQWKGTSQEAIALRNEWTLKAKRINSDPNSKSIVLGCDQNSDPGGLLSAVVHNPEQENDKRLKQIAFPSSPGFGSMGLGDTEWALSRATVDKEYGVGFVKNFSFDWRNRTGQPIQEQDPFPSSTVRIGCLQQYGFCHTHIRYEDRFKQVTEQLRQFISSHRRKHLVGKKNHGPKVSIPHSLLVLKDMQLPSGWFQQVFFMFALLHIENVNFQYIYIYIYIYVFFRLFRIFMLYSTLPVCLLVDMIGLECFCRT